MKKENGNKVFIGMAKTNSDWGFQILSVKQFYDY